MPPLPTLTIQLPGLPPVEHVLRDEAVTVGRMKGNSIALDDVSVSLVHAKITRFGEDYYLKDLNSTNGTLLNGQSISEARLHDGDQLKFGEVRAVFRRETVAGPALAQSVPGLPAAPPPAATAPMPAPPLRSPRRRFWPRVVGFVGGAAGLLTVGIILWQMMPAARDRTAVPDAGSAVAPAAAAALPSAAEAARPAPHSSGEEAAPDARSAGELAAALRDADVAERRRAARRLSGLGEGVESAEPALPALRAALADDDEEVRLWAAIALVNHQEAEPAAVPILLRGLRHPEVACRQLACLSLALFPHDDAGRVAALGALREVAAQDRDEGVRRDALTAMKYLTPEAGAP